MVLITGVGHPAMGHMSKLIDTVLLVPQHEEQAYNSCNGILHMCTDQPKLLAEEATLCVESGACRYSVIRRIIWRRFRHFDGSIVDLEVNKMRNNSILIIKRLCTK